tara:strand:- start:1178 stop:2131 length:954 start_codon:yes stop_codon:yes gene_type:complete
MKKKVVFLSNPVIDISIPIESFPICASEHQSSFDDVVITPGGNATTLFCGVRLGVSMQALGNLGDDKLGSFWQESLMAEGVDVSNMLITDNSSTAVTIVPTVPNGQHVFLGASKWVESGPKVLPSSWNQALTNASILMIDGWSYKSMGCEVIESAIRVAQSSGVSIFFDPGPEISHIPSSWTKSIFARSNVVLLTFEEASAITNPSTSPEEVIRNVCSFGPEIVILKLGIDGIMGLRNNELLSNKAFNVDVRDTTGAGDSLLAAVALSYLKGDSLTDMLLLANATGAACVKKLGAGVNAPYKDEIIDILKDSNRDLV